MKKETKEMKNSTKNTIIINFEDDNFLLSLYSKAKTGELKSLIDNYLIKESLFCNSLNPILLEEYMSLKKIKNNMIKSIFFDNF